MGEPQPTGPRNAFYTSDVVVALEHAELVIATLKQLGVDPRGVERSDDLGLALLRLTDQDVADAHTRIRENTEQKATSDRERSDLDQFLEVLRRHLALRYAGWRPTLGKNRLVGSVEGTGQIGHSGEGDPEPSDWRPRAGMSRRPGLGVRVGVLDTAVFPHPDLEGRFIGFPADVMDSAPDSSVGCHGTFVAGLVLRQAPGCTVEVRKVLSTETAAAESWDVAKKIVELGRTGLDVLNLSMVCYTEDGEPPLVLATAIDRLDPDIVVVAAAGNHGHLNDPEEGNKPAWPAALDDVIAVGAAKNDGDPADFTPSDAPWIDVSSNGVNVDSSFLTGEIDVRTADGRLEKMNFRGHATWSGSSFAAALVSGAIAAGTVPGRTTARAAWQKLSERAKEESAQKNAGAERTTVHTLQEAAPRPTPRRPPFLKLLA
jgi:membrane-anchored mycosin MYCP